MLIFALLFNMDKDLYSEPHLFRQILSPFGSLTQPALLIEIFIGEIVSSFGSPGRILYQVTLEFNASTEKICEARPWITEVQVV